jgi:hypothetical protein
MSVRCSVFYLNCTPVTSLHAPAVRTSLSSALISLSMLALPPLSAVRGMDGIGFRWLEELAWNCLEALITGAILSPLNPWWMIMLFTLQRSQTQCVPRNSRRDRGQEGLYFFSARMVYFRQMFRHYRFSRDATKSGLKEGNADHHGRQEIPRRTPARCS